IEITKLVEEKRGGGVSVPVEAFEGRNLIFVDEGHKGAGGKAWRSYREDLGETGFTFEYSATFGQALGAARNDPLTVEYGKAIVFDYSYRYFYGDGFGKDFRILNLRDDTDKEQTHLLLMGNLLSFYEQLRLYEEHGDELHSYNLEKPLWVFVGSTVNAVYTENKKPRSDVLTVARFLHKVLRERDWATKAIKNLLAGKSGLVAADGSDVFLGRFRYVRELEATPQALYDDILQRVFYTAGSGGLHLATIRGSQGEIGLKAAGAEGYFGLIYIGDTSKFKNLVEEQAPEITLEEDALSDSLFNDINRPDSRIHILIGAKKFMEGWNSWRVSNMGLLNIGRSEGSQIIQLFGRGVRLKGKKMCLKRSSALPGKHPKHIRLLETLNIFAVRANYMAQFRNYLEREGVETEAFIELSLPTLLNKQALRKKLLIPRVPEDKSFREHVLLYLEADNAISVRVDLSVRVQTLESTTYGLHAATVQSGIERHQIPIESLALVNWEQVYLDLLNYKARKGWHNLVLQPDTPRQLMAQINYTLIADEATVRPPSFAERRRLQDAVTAILGKYMETFYRHRRERWETQIMECRPLDEDDPNLALNRDQVGKGRAAYIIQVPRSEVRLLEEIHRLAQDVERLYYQEDGPLPRIHFDGHLYLPLLVQESEKLKIIPPALNQSEARFVCDLKDFWEKEKLQGMAGKEVYILRNLSRGRGIGFFENRGFYPDFILWVLDQATGDQRVIFTDPHGMLHARAYQHDEKARLWERLKKLREASHHGKCAARLDAYIVSSTPYQDLYKYYENGNWTKEDFAQHHILFQERNHEYDYIRLMLLEAESSSRAE
ncbi:MAG: restriction endonuclease subunit R, partial [Anaerolineae bacterium]|nr:restriction endonuclease subunit R [Anaerolineae bacterium]